jgi:glyceraldehyde 3-phosphate dehydrogenase
MAKVAINGFGRIGRIFFRQAFGNKEIDIVAINDLGDLDNLAYLLKYDSVYNAYDKSVETKDGKLVVDGKKISVLQEKDPANLPWKDLDIDVVVESTGAFTTLEKSKPHLDAGAKRVVITAPAKDEVTPTATPNVGMKVLAEGTVMAIMANDPGIKKAVLNTVHGYTATQSLVDAPAKKDFRRGRAAAQNIVPSSTGAAIATTRALPQFKDKFDGIALRVPVLTVSVMDITFISERKTSVKEINNIFMEKAESDEWKDIISVVEDPIVSTDIIKQPFGSIIDLSMTRVVDGDMVKILSWYDNEWGYAAMLAKHVIEVSKIL